MRFILFLLAKKICCFSAIHASADCLLDASRSARCASGARVTKTVCAARVLTFVTSAVAIVTVDSIAFEIAPLRVIDMLLELISFSYGEQEPFASIDAEQLRCLLSPPGNGL
jgi:hypothetical protein